MTRAPGLMTAGELLASASTRYGDAIAFICASTGRSVSFRDLDRRVDRLALALLGLALEPGDVVAFLSSNRLEAVEIYYALARSGLIGLPLSYRFAAPEMIAAIEGAGAKLLIHEARYDPMIAAIRGAVPTLTLGLRFGGAGDDYEAVIAAAPSGRPAVAVGDEDPFYFNMTSGTTGNPKSYLLTHRNNTLVAPFIQALDIGQDDVVMTVFPLFGRVGFGWTTVSLFLGIPNVLADFDPGAVLASIADHRVTTINLVPTMAAMLVAAQTRAPQDLSALRGIILAGAHTPPTLRAEAAATLCPALYEFYGMNEMGPLCVSRPAEHEARPHAVGKPIVFAAVRIIGPDGETLPAGHVGEVLGRSPMATDAYHGNPEATAETFRQGWVHTGDLGCLDEDGALSLRGRKKDMILTGGQNVYAAEVENVLARVPGVADCAVIGLPDDFWGERVVAVVVTEGACPTAEQLEAHCRAHLSGYKVPKAFLFDTRPLPRTPTAKVQKFLLVERYGRQPAE